MDQNKLLKDRYVLKETLGRGGMAVVYRARDRMLERDVSIKVLKEDYAADHGFRERFRQEAKAAANLSHPNIVTVHDFGIEKDQLFIVMEYVPGKDLYTLIEEKGRLDVRLGISLAIKACKGLGYAHRAGFIHCDVKPHNFIVTENNQLKVTDFGIARALASVNPDELADVVWGSPQYYSPEQASGHAPSRASDVYSLGVVMYQMFTGQLPFIGATSRELARLHQHANPINPSEINPFIPDDLSEVILKVLAKEPSARYRTADQLGRVLQLVEDRIKKEGPVESPRPSIQRPPSRPIPTTPPQPSQSEIDPDSAPIQEESQSPVIDWLAVILGLAALSSVGGLIPFGIWVYNAFFPVLP